MLKFAQKETLNFAVPWYWHCRWGHWPVPGWMGVLGRLSGGSYWDSPVKCSEVCVGHSIEIDGKPQISLQFFFLLKEISTYRRVKDGTLRQFVHVCTVQEQCQIISSVWDWWISRKPQTISAMATLSMPLWAIVPGPTFCAECTLILCDVSFSPELQGRNSFESSRAGSERLGMQCQQQHSYNPCWTKYRMCHLQRQGENADVACTRFSGLVRSESRQ